MEDKSEEYFSHPIWALREKQAELISERLILRRPDFKDAEALAKLADNTKIQMMLASLQSPYGLVQRRYTIDNADAFIKRIDNGEHPALVYGIYDKQDENFIGVCELNYGNKEITSLGYWVGEPYWNKAYCTEAVRCLIDFCFNQSNIHEIHAACRVINDASRRVLEKCGFRYMGDGLEYSAPNFGSQAMERYLLDKKTWASLKEWK